MYKVVSKHLHHQFHLCVPFMLDTVGPLMLDTVSPFMLDTVGPPSCWSQWVPLMMDKVGPPSCWTQWVPLMMDKVGPLYERHSGSLYVGHSGPFHVGHSGSPSCWPKWVSLHVGQSSELATFGLLQSANKPSDHLLQHCPLHNASRFVA